MDANGQRFWLLAGPDALPAVQHTVWDAGCRRLRLASERTLVPVLAPALAFAAAQAAVDQVPRAADALESVARWDPARNAVVVYTRLPDGTVLPDTALWPLGEAPSDLCTGADGVLYAVLPGTPEGAIRLHDLRGRFADVSVTLAGFAPWRLAPAADGGVWAIERNTGAGSARLARLRGRPRREPAPQPDDYDGRVFRPSPENGCAPVIQVVAAGWAGSERVLALAAGPDGAVAVLTWRDGDGSAVVRRWQPEVGRFGPPLALQGAAYAYGLAWLGPDRIALRLPGRRDAPAFNLSTALGGVVQPLGEVYPLPADAVEAPFCNGVAQPPMVPTATGGGVPLYPLSLNQLARRGEAASFDSGGGGRTFLVDSGSTTTVWHRLYAEAQIPAHCGFVAWLAATNEVAPPPLSDLSAWHAHGFGRDIAQLDDAMQAPQLPRAAWQREPSEVPGHPGLLGLADEPVPPGTRGLFSVLVQNSRQRVRNLVGRYLWVRLVLHGDGRTGPEIAALRAWGSRFNYAERYLPGLYRERLFGDAARAPGERLGDIEPDHHTALDAGGPIPAVLRARLALLPLPVSDRAVITVESPGRLWLLQDGASAWRLMTEPGAAPGPLGGADVIAVYRPQASPADFNARLLANFEGVLTTLEDRVAAAHLVSEPATVPDDSLDWLAGWIGVAFDAALPTARRRDWLRAAPAMATRHGTRDGLRLALDVATGGAVRTGAVVVVEDFRLRRVLATLLGVDLGNEHDPLLPGLVVSGNSIVGDTLVLGDAERAELLALFDVSVATAAEADAVLAFDARVAHRATVLVHGEGLGSPLSLIRRIVQLESPAHVAVSVQVASWPLLVGVASLLDVDTFLGPPRTPQPVQVQRSVLGGGDVLQVQPLLDPRLSGVPVARPPPNADAGPDRTTVSTTSLLLDGSASRAGPGRRLTEYRWRWLPPAEA